MSKGKPAKTKDQMSEIINEAYGLEGKAKIDFSRLRKNDLDQFFVMTLVQKVDQQEQPEAPRQEREGLLGRRGILGLGILNGRVINRFMESGARKGGIVDKLMGVLTTDDLDRVTEKFPALGKILPVLLEELTDSKD